MTHRDFNITENRQIYKYTIRLTTLPIFMVRAKCIANVLALLQCSTGFMIAVGVKQDIQMCCRIFRVSINIASFQRHSEESSRTYTFVLELLLPIWQNTTYRSYDTVSHGIAPLLLNSTVSIILLKIMGFEDGGGCWLYPLKVFIASTF